MARLTGVLAISIDVELAWGVFDLPHAAGFLASIGQVLGIVGELLAVFRRHDLNATWTIVWHLLLDWCERQGCTIHAELTRPRRTWFPHDRFRDNPGADRAAASLLRS